ncbi:MFS transporter [Arthrobacter sp. ISL-48]|uniref:MFS transporter n=1 Tax=Arthrobacter sp. ISL-48 TaxID=2819110 RepID=UPI001BED1354|nr:MFS transporter [Arthrobacter sp. ISL-48]MBT2531099.1 MFS transporter [Arthrobacter sp. ISL-48]
MTVLPRLLRQPFSTGFSSYKSILMLPGSLQFFVPSVIARFGVSMIGLSMLWSVEALTGSFAVAGSVTGAFAISEAVVGPQIARLIDRAGQGRILPGLIALNIVAITLLLSAASQVWPMPVVLVLAAFAGASTPQPGALSAARWSVVAATPEDLRTAYSLEAVVNDVGFLVGPILVTVLSVSIAPLAGVIFATVCVATGCLFLSTRRETEPSTEDTRSAGAVNRGLYSPAFCGLLAVNLSLGFFFGSVPITITALAAESHVSQLTGLMLAATSVISLISGLVYGSRTWPGSPERVLVIVSLFLSIMVGIAAVSHLALVASIAIAAAGAAIAPIVATSNLLIQRTVPPNRLTQSFTWINSASAAGIALAAALVGAAIDSGGSSNGFMLAALLVAATPASAILTAVTAARRGQVPESADQETVQEA